MKHLLLSISIASLSLFGLSACNDDKDITETTQSTQKDNDTQKPAEKVTPNLVDLAKSNQDLSILVEAVVSAGLADTLASKDTPAPFTIFAPTNKAFAQLLTDKNLTKEQLLGNKELLKQVLTHHVVAGGAVKKADVPVGKPLQSLEGDAITVVNQDDMLKVKDGMGGLAGITATDLMATNGVVHVIDKVLMPAEKNLVEVAQGNADFSILVEAVTSAGLADTLASTDKLTVFAPTNDAFNALFTELNLTKEEVFAQKELLTQVLKYHVVSDLVYSSEVAEGDMITLQGITFNINADTKLTDERSRVASLVATDVQASNGVIHVIDKVLLPKAN